MRKLIGAFNMTLDGICDHTAVTADEQIHKHYEELLNNAGVILYGRKTYQLMEYWKSLIKDPSGEQSLDNFAKVMDRTPKLVFSNTLKDLHWETAQLAEKGLEEEVVRLKQQTGSDIYAGSRSLIVQLMNLHLLDEFQICIHPVIAGKGMSLFENLTDRFEFNLIKTKSFSGGAVIHYYKPVAI